MTGEIEAFWRFFGFSSPPLRKKGRRRDSLDLSPLYNDKPLPSTRKFEPFYSSPKHHCLLKKPFKPLADVRGDDFVQALTSLFRDIGSALDANRDAVVETFGQTAMLDVATALHAECDIFGARVLRAYCQHRRLGALMQQTNALQSPEKGLGSSAATSMTAAATAAAAVDPRQVEEYLDEVLVLAQLCDEYNQYVLAAMSEATAPESLGAARENSFRSGAFNQTVRELVSYYIQMVRRKDLVVFLGEGERERRERAARERRKERRAVGAEEREGGRKGGRVARRGRPLLLFDPFLSLSAPPTSLSRPQKFEWQTRLPTPPEGL